MKLSRVLVGLLILGFAVGAVSQKSVYRNPEYGIVLPIPTGTLPCIPPIYEGNGADHGPQILLGTKDASLCSASSGKRYVNVFASYNSAYPTMSLQTLLATECQFETKSLCTAAPAGLGFGRLKSIAGRSDRPDGSIEIIVATQAGRPDPDVDASAPSINYELFLHTDLQHFEEDLVVFRALLETIRIRPHLHYSESQDRP
jgi:hypothetical protein